MSRAGWQIFPAADLTALFKQKVQKPASSNLFILYVEQWCAWLAPGATVNRNGYNGAL